MVVTEEYKKWVSDWDKISKKIVDKVKEESMIISIVYIQPENKDKICKS